MGAGKYNKRFAIQIVTETDDDDYLTKSKSWATDRYIWGQLKPNYGREKVQAGSIDASKHHVIKTRHDSALTVKNRLVWNSRIFRIFSVLDVDEMGRELEIKAVEDL